MNARKAISEFAKISYSSMTSEQINFYVREMIIENMRDPFRPGNSIEAWVRNPMPSMNEPHKHIAAITNIERLELDHQANLYRKGSLHAIDRFFMQIRRKVYLFERPFHSGSNQSRVWNGYSPYNPEMYQKLADIFRVFYNYCVPYDSTGDTPAMRLNLAKGVVDIEKIIYFDKYNNK